MTTTGAPSPLHSSYRGKVALVVERAGQEAQHQAALSTPMRRIDSDEEVAATVLWLCSDQASFVTGVTVPIDGGQYADLKQKGNALSYPDPKYFGDKGEISAIYRPASQPPDLEVGANRTLYYVATGISTHGQFGLYRWDSKSRSTGPNAHFHRTMSESFFILSGTMRLFNGERWIDATAGDFLYVPEGGIHAFHNESDEPSSMLILFAPGAPREGYFEALAERAAGRQFSEEEWKDLCIRHDNYFI